MKNWHLIDTDHLPDGAELTLYEREGEHMIRCNGLELMTSEAVGSEEAFVKFGLEQLATEPGSVLIGGLGLGFTLAEVCRRMPETEILVAEISEAVVRWLKGPASNHNTHLLDGPLVTLQHADVLQLLKQTDTVFDLILLDVDNGPEALVHPGNEDLYHVTGLQCVASRLSPNGAAVFWSAIEAPWFEGRLSHVFSTVNCAPLKVSENPRIEHFHYVVTKS